MGGKIARGFGVERHHIGGLDVSEVGRGEYGVLIFGRIVP